MNRTELAELLQLPPNTNQRNIVARVLKHHVAGGAELVDAKEWASGIANSSRDPGSARVARDALAKLAAIEHALLTALERSRDLPAGTLTAYQRTGLNGD